MRYYLVDAFADRPFRGNPAVVCILDAPLPDATMAAVAREMNLSETAFVIRALATEGREEWRLRWFTPTMEIRLCGHATLATARTLLDAGLATGPEIRFATLSGELVARVDGEWIELDFPALPPSPAETPLAMIEALGLAELPRWSGVNEHRNWVLDIGNAEAVRSLKPDREKTMALDCHGIVVTGRGDGEYDFTSRFFAPESGVFEDPVTGSAHVAIAPYWSGALGKDRFLAYQASARGGSLRIGYVADPKGREPRVRMAGKSVIVAKGEFEDSVLRS